MSPQRWKILESVTLGQAIGLRVYTVIPKYFPQFCLKEKPSSSSDRMNRFLNYLKMWGFEEVKEVGPDMGSNQNEVSFLKFEKMKIPIDSCISYQLVIWLFVIFFPSFSSE